MRDEERRVGWACEMGVGPPVVVRACELRGESSSQHTPTARINSRRTHLSASTVCPIGPGGEHGGQLKHAHCRVRRGARTLDQLPLRPCSCTCGLRPCWAGGTSSSLLLGEEGGGERLCVAVLGLDLARKPDLGTVSALQVSPARVRACTTGRLTSARWRRLSRQTPARPRRARARAWHSA